MSYKYHDNKLHLKGVELEIVNSQPGVLLHEDGRTVGINQSRKVTLDTSKLSRVTTGRIQSTNLAVGDNVFTVAPFPIATFNKFEAIVRSNTTGEEILCRLINQGTDTFTLRVTVASANVRVTWFAID